MSDSNDVVPPETLRAHLSEAAFELRWPDEESCRIGFRELRGLCPCANCVNELTGQRKFFAADADPDIHPKKLDLVGNYAVKISWSDGHHTGLFTWKNLRKICAAESDSSRSD